MDLSATPSTARSQDSVPQVMEQLEQWLSKRWVIMAINIALLLLLTYSIAQWTWRLLTPPIPDNAGAVPVIATDNTAEFNLAALTEANLYGRVAPAASTPAEIPLSTLNLSLTGVFAAPKGGVALISADGGPETAFGVGDEIVAGVVLHEVLANRVLIKRGDATESLLLKDTTPDLAEGSIATGAPKSGAAVKPSPSAGEGIQQIDPNRFNVSRQQINKQMEKPDFLTQALMVPNAGGGFLVRQIQPGSVYEKLGLRVGDVINNVNGQPVNTMQDVMKFYQQFTSSGAAQVSIEVRRAGKSETLQYNIR